MLSLTELSVREQGCEENADAPRTGGEVEGQRRVDLDSLIKTNKLKHTRFGRVVRIFEDVADEFADAGGTLRLRHQPKFGGRPPKAKVAAQPKPAPAHVRKTKTGTSYQASRRALKAFRSQPPLTP